MAFVNSFFSLDMFRTAWNAAGYGNKTASRPQDLLGASRRGAGQDTASTTSAESRFGAHSQVSLSPQARDLMAVLDEVEQRLEAAKQAAQGRTTRQATGYEERAKALLSSDEGEAMGKAVDSLFDGATAPEAEDFRDRLDKLVGRLTPPMTEIKPPAGRRANKDSTLFILTDSEMRTLRMEARTEGDRQVLRVTYVGHDLGSVDMTVERRDTGEGAEKESTLKGDFVQRAILSSGRLDRRSPPVEEAHYDGPLTVPKAASPATGAEATGATKTGDGAAA